MPPLEDTKEAFDWKQGAPSGTVLLPLQTHEDDNQLRLEHLGFQIGCIVWCSHSIIQCSRECYGTAAFGCWSKRGMGGVCKWGRHIWTSTFALYGVNHGLPPWYKARMTCPSQGCARPGIHPDFTLRVRSALENRVLPLDSSAREPRSGSRRTIEEYLHWSRHMPPPTDIKEALPLLYLEIGEGGEAAGRARVRGYDVRTRSSLLRMLCTAASVMYEQWQRFSRTCRTAFVEPLLGQQQ